MFSLEKFIKYLTLFLMIILPILDMTFFFSRITTLAEVLIILLLLLLTLINKKESRKKFMYLLAYYFVILIYLIINYYRAGNFNSLFPNDFNYSLYNELTTIIKLSMPATLLFILKYQNISNKEYFNIIKYWTIFISGIIIITNIFKIGLSSYGSGNITYNIFEWYKNPYYLYSASKGFFNYANQQSCVLIMLLVMQTYLFFEEENKKISLVYIIMLVISMLMLGTRISSLGGLLVLIFLSFFHFIYKKIIVKEKYNKKNILILIPILVWGLLLSISPYSNRNNELYTEPVTESAQNSTNNAEEENNDLKEVKSDDEINMQEFVDSNHNPDRLPEIFFKNYYSYEYDPEFWYDFVKNTNINDINYRMIEINIIKRVKEINNNKLDDYFGISNSRIQNIVNIERDWTLHYYAYGIIGSIILLIIYPFLLFIIIKEILNKKRIIDIFILFTICLFILCSYLSGNIVNYMITIMPLIYIFNGINIDKA